VLSARDAATMLAGTDSWELLGAIGQALSFGHLEELDDRTVEALGADGHGERPRVAAGAGALRMLAVCVPRSRGARETLLALARRLASHTPQVLWCVAVAERDGSALALGCWSIERHPPRTAALVVDRAAVTDSDVETLLGLATAASGPDLLVHARWMETLGRSAVGRRFFAELEQRVEALATSARGSAAAAVRRDVALCYTSRLLFLSFLQAKRWLNDDRQFLYRTFEECMTAGGGYDERVLRPLFFGTLNTRIAARSRRAAAFGRIPFLNGGLFSRTPAERRAALAFDDEALGELHARLLTRFRFTVRENSSTWSEAAVDPEILGRAFESLMNQGERRSSGTYYTPQPLVDRLVASALAEALRERSPLEITALDPACGSGAFLVHVLERLADIAIERGDVRRPEAIRREVLSKCIFGVDLNPTAVWLCELRLWLSVVIDAEVSDPTRVPPLPNLDRNIRVGDTLLGAELAALGDRGAAGLRKLRERYARATGPRKISLGRTLDRAERRRALVAIEREIVSVDTARRERAAAGRAPDLFGERSHRSGSGEVACGELRERARRLRRERQRLADGGAVPFSFSTHFADVSERGGFDLVVGNPPWVRLHNIAPETRAALRERFAVFRAPAWSNGYPANGGHGFAAQPDLAAAFIERGLRLLRLGGTLALLVPAKLWKSLAGAGVRALLQRESELALVEDWSDAPSSFDAAVYPSLVVARRRCGGGARGEVRGGNASRGEPHAGVAPRGGELRAAACRVGRQVSWTCRADELPLDESVGSPWLIVPAPVRDAFYLLRARGTPLAQSCFGRPMLGLKSGMNEAFIVSVRSTACSAGAVAVTGGDGQHAEIEAERLRPLLRGEQVREWRRPPARDYLVWTHGSDGRPLERLPPRTERWLRRWRSALGSRSDRKVNHPWWSLYRTEGAAPGQPRVVWCDVGRTPRAVVLDASDPVVPLNSCYVVRCPAMDDAWALAALFNSTLAAAWLDVIAEPARGRYKRYLAWTTALLPLPADWPRARAILAPLGRSGCEGDPPHPGALLEAVLRSFDVSAERLLPLVEWLQP
jgi:hypothetical protein